MHITYFDEVKYQLDQQPYECIGGIVADEALVRELEDQVGDLAKIIDRHGEVFKVYARLELARMIATDGLDEKTFMYFIERVDMQVGSKMATSMLIGDFDKAEVPERAAWDLSIYRERGTP